MSNNVNQKYWMVVDEDKTIMGIGTTQALTIADGKNVMRSLQREGKLSKPIRCSNALFSYVVDNIVTIHDTWTIVAGVAELDYHVNTKENIEEMRALIDEMSESLPYLIDESMTPAQLNEFRDNWMDKARKHKTN